MMLKVGVIGYGARINGVIKFLTESNKVRLTAIMDVRPFEEIKETYLDKNGYTNVKYYNDAREMLESEEFDGICIGTNCDTHTDYALLVAEYNIPMFLEKPVCTKEEDLERLKSILRLNDKVVVSFPLRVSQMVTNVKELLDSGKIGKVEHVQAYNNVPYGRGYYHKWYRDDSITGGLFLQKSTHDFDYINYLLGEDKPVRICAMKSKQIFKGNEPAGMLCENCSKTKECPESPENVAKLGDGYEIGKWCCFATDTGNEDSGSAIIEYESGMHVVYSQDFIVRGGAGKRGARLIGYLGTLEFDWMTGIITVYRHLENITETYKIVDTGVSHFGGDKILSENFIDVMNGCDISHTSLEEGILSAKMCLMARKSSEEYKFFDIK